MNANDHETNRSPLSHDGCANLTSAESNTPSNQPLTGTGPASASPELATEPVAEERQPKQPEAETPYVLYGLVLITIVALASALHWSWYPLFVDTYYHMAVIQGMQQAGGLPTWAFWEMAPGGRVHIYPPAIHVLGYLATYVGWSPQSFITFLSWSLYPAFLFTTWLWLRKVFGPRAALTTVILLCGPSAVFWNQTTFTANAFSMTLAPLALLALESEHFLACGVLNLLAATAHPMGLFLPPALVINVLLRRKKIFAGLLAASVPVLLYSPWLAHIWANRAYLPEQRTGSDVSLMGIGAGSGLNLGVAITAATLLGLFWIAKRRRVALSLIGPALGFAVVLPMGFGGRFFQFNIHWPLACIGGYGVGVLLEWLDQRFPKQQSVFKAASISLAFFALATWAAFEIPMPKQFRDGPGRNDARNETRNADRPANAVTNAPGAPVRFAMGMSSVVKLFDPDTRPAPFGGGAGGMPGGGRPGGFAGVGPVGFPGGFPGGAPGQPGGFGGPGLPPNIVDQKSPPFVGNNPANRTDRAPRDLMRGNRNFAQQGNRGGPGGPGGMDMIHQEGAKEFFDAISKNVIPGEVVYAPEGPAASLLTGVTGCWTTGGILRDVKSAESRSSPVDCQYMAIMSSGGDFRRGGGTSTSEAPPGFRKVFENSFGSLWKNKTLMPSKEPAKAAISVQGLVILALLGLFSIYFDLFYSHVRKNIRILVVVVVLGLSSICLASLTYTAIQELRNPPKVSNRGGNTNFDQPPGMRPMPGVR